MQTPRDAYLAAENAVTLERMTQTIRRLTLERDQWRMDCLLSRHCFTVLLQELESHGHEREAW